MKLNIKQKKNIRVGIIFLIWFLYLLDVFNWGDTVVCYLALVVISLDYLQYHLQNKGVI